MDGDLELKELERKEDDVVDLLFAEIAMEVGVLESSMALVHDLAEEPFEVELMLENIVA